LIGIQSNQIEIPLEANSLGDYFPDINSRPNKVISLNLAAVQKSPIRVSKKGKSMKKKNKIQGMLTIILNFSSFFQK
jgi:hypothetical protein